MSIEIFRHRTAIKRDKLSAPMKALWNLGFFDKPYSTLDYGCGHADDVSILQEKNITIKGWDPHFFPSTKVETADIVNLGYVLNVIEDISERSSVLKKAFSLANRVLSIAVMLNGQGQYENPKPYKDGFLTKRNTFQKYYTQAEFKEFVEEELGIEAISIAPGVFFVFTKPSYEQEFLFQKQNLRRIPHTNLYSLSKLQNKLKWEEHKELVEEFWQACLQFARVPTVHEFSKYAEVEDKLGRVDKVFKYLLSINEKSVFEEARQSKKNNVLVYLALNFFEKRKSFSSLPSGLKNDIKALFGSYKKALEEGKEKLYEAGDQQLIADLCQKAVDSNIGVLQRNKYLVLNKLIQELPPVLRIYIGCTSVLYSDALSADLICLYLHSTKVDLRTYDDFEAYKIPILLERVFVEFQRLKVDYVSYHDRHRTKRLFLKSKYLPKDAPTYKQQLKFDKVLIKYVGEGRLHSDFSPLRIISAVPKTYKRKYKKELDR